MEHRLHHKSLEIARAMANFESKRCFHVTLIYKGSKLLVIGENKSKTHARNRFNSRWDLGKKGQCSELSAFIKAKNTYSKLNWQKLTMVNVRLGRKGEILNSCPCKSCESLILYSGIQNVIYSTESGFKIYKL